MYSFVSPLLYSRLVRPAFVAGLLGLLSISAHAQITLWDAPAPRSSVAAARAAVMADRRSEIVSGRSMMDLSKIPAQSALTIPLVGGKKASGNVTFKYADGSGDETVAGVLPDSSLSGFSIRRQGAKVTGEVRQYSTRKAYKIEGWTFGEIEITEVPLDTVLCVGYPVRAPLAGPPSPSAAPVAKAPPILESNPDAPFVLLIDFDGYKNFRDPGWEGGRTMTFDPAKLNEQQMAQAWAAVAEDFRFLNINVTTSEEVFLNTPPSKRVRCVVTPTNFAPGSGGLALIGTFGSVDNARTDVSAVCFSFNNDNPKVVADTISHEVGHTLGLGHDGTKNPNGSTKDDYFGGHNGWAPIMGAGYSAPVTQWSKGEYLNANNTEDDLQIMARKANIGFVADDASDAIDGADNIYAPTGTVEQTGVISTTTDVDVFRLPLDGGTLNITASPAEFSPDLKIQLVLVNEKGKEIIASDNTTSELSAKLRKANLPKGKYYLFVRNSGYGDPLTNGYSTYGSLGSYTISGTIPGQSFPAGNLQPDVIVGTGNAAVGEGLFGALKQEYRVLYGKKKKIKIKGAISNIGLMAESFKLRAFGKFSGHKYTISIKGEDVTKAIKKGRYTTRVLKPGQKLRLDMVFVPKRTIRKTKTLFIGATAVGDKERMDRVAITLVPGR